MKLSNLLTASFLSLLALPAAASASTGVAKHRDKDDSSTSFATAFKNLSSSLSALESSSFKTKTNGRRLSHPSSQCGDDTFGSDDFDGAYETIEFIFGTIDFILSYFSNVNIDDQTCTSNDAYPDYEYTCDTGNYFDHEAIQEICDDQGGNKITFELLIKHDNGTTGIIPDLPMCIANSCDDPWDIILILNLGFFSEFDEAGVTIEARTPGNEGMECLHDTLANYGFEWPLELWFGNFGNATNPNGLSPYIPMAIFQREPAEFCNITNSTEVESYDCDASRVFPNAEIESICVAAGGKYIEIDHTGGQGYYGSLKNVPWCLASTCKVEAGVVFSDFLT